MISEISLFTTTCNFLCTTQFLKLVKYVSICLLIFGTSLNFNKLHQPSMLIFKEFIYIPHNINPEGNQRFDRRIKYNILFLHECLSILNRLTLITSFMSTRIGQMISKPRNSVLEACASITSPTLKTKNHVCWTTRGRLDFSLSVVRPLSSDACVIKRVHFRSKVNENRKSKKNLNAKPSKHCYVG